MKCIREMDRIRIVLRLNAVSCLAFGALFVLLPEPVWAFLGTPLVGTLRIVGLLLILNGAHLALASVRERLWPREILYFSAGDIIWFTASIALVGADVLVKASVGQTAAVIVATGVLELGLAQIWMLAESVDAGVPETSVAGASHGYLLPPELSRAKAIGVSWSAMKLWIKIWLFALNALFLTALAFLPEPAARLTLAAYVASGPLLAAIMIWQRGLTRLLGIAHLVAWLPLVVYLGLRLSSDLVDQI